MAGRILIVDDEPIIIGALATLLRTRGYDVSSATTGHAALDILEREKPHVIVLDLALPDMDGLDVCRRVRDASAIPILVLSAREAEDDKVNALDAGADDYVTKPFGAEELLARIRVALRRADRSPAIGEPVIKGDLVIDRERFRVVRNGEALRLTPKEFELLSYMAQHSDRVLTHRILVKAVWGPHATNDVEHLRVLVGSLRKKIEPIPSAPKYIVTEPWIGYRFADSG